jgi:uncharacterized protein YacL
VGRQGQGQGSETSDLRLSWMGGAGLRPWLGEPRRVSPHGSRRVSAHDLGVYTLGVGIAVVDLVNSWLALTGRDGAPVHSFIHARPACEMLIPVGLREYGTDGFSTAAGGLGCVRGGLFMQLVLIRLLFVIVVAATCYVIGPFRLTQIQDAGVGAAVGAAIVLCEWQLRRVSLKRLIGAAIGSLLGICGAYLFSLVIRSSVPAGSTQSFLQILVMLLMAYVGLAVGATKGDLLNLAALGGIFGGEKQSKKSYKILDTSVIIDGRIADIAETGFLDGIIVTPQFVLRELQLVADSADSLKRNRGRRGLDILQRLQKIATLQIQIVENDFPAVREVDLKLIELAKVYEGKIITNDFNLNKVAQLQGVEVLNINELANSLKPIVLPGETMRVFILKEGKEYNQGVAYLDDGTMVVVDNARKMIGKTIDVSVTSVLQTTAGKMIFGKWDERTAYSRQSVAVPVTPVAVVGVPVVAPGAGVVIPGPVVEKPGPS